jgi:uncharacterized protein
MKFIPWLLLFSIVLADPSGAHAAQESGPVEAKIKTLMVDPNSQSPVVVLETVADKRLLPIWIDIPEARSIAMELEHVATPRPLTHDLIRNILQKLGATLQRVIITDLRNNTYYAVLSLAFKGQELRIDSRPSDAIAVALRMKAPIYASTEVLAKSKSAPVSGARGDQSHKKLGIQVQDLTVELATLLDIGLHNGVLVADAGFDSVATRAGIQRGDIITKANDRVIKNTKDFEAFIQALKPPAQVRLEVIKKGKSTLVVIDLPS